MSSTPARPSSFTQQAGHERGFGVSQDPCVQQSGHEFDYGVPEPHRAAGQPRARLRRLFRTPSCRQPAM
eukprot:11778850-Alexandrium_andersonii.AAC.1